MSPKSYKIYRITGPKGKIYVGMTSMKMNERWGAHTRSLERPLSKAIAEHGRQAFSIEILEEGLPKEEARLREHLYIVEHDSNNPEKGYNILSGDDKKDSAGLHFWTKIKQDPVALDEFKARLSAACKNGRHMLRIDVLLAAAEKWRQENPEKVKAQALKSSQTRLANLMAQPERAAKIIANREKNEKAIKRTDKEKTTILHKEKALNQWKNRTEEEKRIVKENISKALKLKFANRTEEQKQRAAEQLKKARENVDKEKWRTNIAEGRKNYWTPERRAAKGEWFRKKYSDAKENENV